MPIDPFTAFVEGYQNSQKMGLLKLQALQQAQEFAQKQKALAAEAQKQEFEQDTKKIDFLRKVQEDPNTADEDKVKAYNAMSPLIKKHHSFEMTPIDSWNPEYTKATKKINAIWDNGNYAPQDRLQLIRGVYNSVSQGAAEKLKPQLEQAQKEAETSNFTQGMTLSRQIASTPELAQSPEIMNQVLAEKEQLLGGSKEGRDVLAAEMKTGQKDKDTVETMVNGVPVRIPTSVYVAHIDREAQREQNRIFQQENLALRKQIADTTMNLRQRLPAEKAKELGDKQQKLDRYASLIGKFADEYGGAIIGGPTMTKVYERTGGQKDRVDWWKNFNEMDSLIRYQLFAGNLTTNEIESWKTQTVNENTDPAIIRQRLQDRIQWATNAMQREIGSYGQAGYSVDQFMGGYGKGAEAAAPSRSAVPSMKEWMGAAIKANPTASKTELIKFYQGKYGKK